MRFSSLTIRTPGMIITITVFVFILIIIGYGCWNYLSPNPVISYKDGQISQGTFSYLRFVFYSDPSKKNYSNEQIYNDCKQNIVVGHLADDLGLKEDPYYYRYLALTHKARIQRAAVCWLKKNIGPDFNLEQAFDIFKINSDPKQATKIIQSCIKRAAHRFRLDCPEIIVGKVKNQELKLSMIKPLLSKKEWQQFLSLLPSPMIDAYKSYLTRFLYHIIHQKVVEKFSPIQEELTCIDHYQVAKQYISVKYGMSHDGIYPTQRLTLDFPKTVLFNHFFAIKHRFLPVETVHVQYTVLENMDIAKKVHEEIQDGGDIINLAKKYAINKHFIKTAYPQKLFGYGVNGTPTHPAQRAIIDNFLLDAAQNNQLFPPPHPLDKGILVACLSQLKRKSLSIQYPEYQFAVKRDLTLKTLKSKLPIDIEDTIELLSFQFFEKNIHDLNVE
ncbi:hypothetical protein MHK_007227 [Candidatus Magnetomorum sp. HK-1]|nr:hypothetical protein MHK_007227 [Candidatus Magnetomorum sp. HK-1]